MKKIEDMSKVEMISLIGSPGGLMRYSLRMRRHAMDIYWEIKERFGEFLREESEKQAIDTLYIDASWILNLNIRDTTELVKLLLPYTSKRFKADIGYTKLRSKLDRNMKDIEKRRVGFYGLHFLDLKRLRKPEFEKIIRARSWREICPIPTGEYTENSVLPRALYRAFKELNRYCKDFFSSS